MVYRACRTADVICWVFLVALGGACVAGYLTKEAHEPVWPIVATSGVWLLVLWLYCRSAVLRFRVEEYALIIERPLGTQVVPWAEITKIRWLASPQVIQIVGHARVHAFLSRELFPKINELVMEISKRSGCDIPVSLRRSHRIHE